MLLFTLPGTPIFYAGDEIGMPNATISTEDARDPFEARVPGYGLNRDPERAPMRWDASEKAGFTTGEPWLPLEEHVLERNIAAQQSDERSMLSLYRQLMALRQTEPALIAGDFQPLRSEGGVLLFLRCSDDKRLLIALNTGDGSQTFALQSAGVLRLNTHLDRGDERVASQLHLRSNEGVVMEMLTSSA